MSILHRATLVPSKLDVIDAWLTKQPWATSTGTLERVGTYRFDDPAGEVGIEGCILGRGDAVYHLVVTYRSAPLHGVAEIGTLHHSVLGQRWVYDGNDDPVALAVMTDAVLGKLAQEQLEVFDGETRVETKESEIGVQSIVEDGAAAGELVMPYVIGSEPVGAARLVASWGERSATVAVVV
jgi:hypothetical protein